MKLEITLTDEQAAPFVAALEAGVWPSRVCPPGECQRCLPADPTKERAKASWTIKVSDSFVEYEFKIAGRGDTSIEEVANNAAEFLKGSIRSSRQTCKYSDPKVEDMIEALECAYHEKVGWMDAVEHALNLFTEKNKP